MSEYDDQLTIRQQRSALANMEQTTNDLRRELAATTERERVLINMLTFFGTELFVNGRLRCKSCFQFIDEDDDSFMTGHANGCLIVRAANHDPVIILPEAEAAAQPASDGQEGK